MFNIEDQFKIGIVRGGYSSEYQLSLQTGSFFFNAFEGKVGDIFISKDGTWHWKGEARKPSRILDHFDVVVNGLHGRFGEDGGIQRIVEDHRRRYTGSEGISAALSLSKVRSKILFEEQGIKTPHWTVLRATENNLRKRARELFRTFPFPAVIKPDRHGAGFGVSKVDSFAGLLRELTHAFDVSDTVLIEEYIPGRVFSCGIIEGFRNTEKYVLPLVEMKGEKIRPYIHMLDTDFVLPSHREKDLKNSIYDVAVRAHTALELSGYSRADIIASPQRGVFLLEVNALPHLGKHSPFSYALQHAGVKPYDFSQHIVSLALQEK